MQSVLRGIRSAASPDPVTKLTFRQVTALSIGRKTWASPSVLYPLGNIDAVAAFPLHLQGLSSCREVRVHRYAGVRRIEW